MEVINYIPEQLKGNDAYMNILNRVSVRRFDDKPVTSEHLSAILHAAMSAPSAVNKQPWEFIVVDDHENDRKRPGSHHSLWKPGEIPLRS